MFEGLVFDINRKTKFVEHISIWKRPNILYFHVEVTIYFRHKNTGKKGKGMYRAFSEKEMYSRLFRVMEVL